MDQESLSIRTTSTGHTLFHRKYLGMAFYTPVLLLYYYVLKNYDHIYENTSTSEAFNTLKRFRKCYFTGWNLTAQICFISVALADEISTLYKTPFTLRKTLGLMRRYIFTAIVFPCTLLVSILFWSLYTLDRELVFPKSLDEHYPPWMVHSVHSFVVLPLIVEMNLNKGNGIEVVDFSYTLPVLTAFLLAYKITLFTVHLLYDVWLYPIFRYLSWWQRSFFLGHVKRRAKSMAVRSF
ncbi:androgen-dependent TFPI-regulating protein-like isoform X2 [Zophobas morio]|uniref:androgen-dependent TFPI-regulating protein-like isoform X2 n=1 Tax=Zophobas morio TaxID=2755281 RepID=UPI003083CD05